MTAMDATGTSNTTLPITRSGRKRKATAKLAESNGAMTKRAVTATKPVLPSARCKVSKATSKPGRTNGGRVHANPGKQRNVPPRAAAAATRKSTGAPSAKSAAVATVVGRQTEPGKHSEVVGLQSTRANKGLDSQSGQAGNPIRSQPVKAAAVRPSRRTATPAAPNDRRGTAESYVPAPNAQRLNKNFPPRRCDQINTEKDGSVRAPHDTVRVHHERPPHVNTAQQGPGSKKSRSGASKSRATTNNVPAQTREKGRGNVYRRAPQGDLNAVATINAAFTAAKKAQSGPALPVNAHKVPLLSTTDAPPCVVGKRQGTPTPSKKPRAISHNQSVAIKPFNDVTGHSSGMENPAREPRTSVNSRLANRPSGISKPTNTLLKKDQRRKPTRDKESISFLPLIHRCLQQFLNDHNEHNKAVRDSLNRMEAQQSQQRQKEQDKLDEICRVLTDIRDRHGVSTPHNTNVTKGRFTLSMVEGCCAMLRYIYSLAGKGDISATYMYPTLKTQEDLIQYVVRSVLAIETGKEPATLQGTCRRIDSVFTLRRDDIDVETDAEQPAYESDFTASRTSKQPAAGSCAAALLSDVKAFLGSKIANTNKISVIETTPTTEESSKKSVKARLLDQRRRFHDHITTPVVNKWLQKCHGFEAFDTSLKTLKQEPSVFLAAANIFEKDENGIRPYVRRPVHGIAFYEACVTLKRMSADHNERALAQAMKAFQDSDKVRKLCELIVNYVNCDNTEVRQVSSMSQRNSTFLPHHLAFVQTKIHARLEWMSQCKMLGGKSMPKPDGSHYGVYLKYLISLDKQVQMKEAAKYSESLALEGGDRPTDLNSAEERGHYIMGLPLLPFLKRDSEAFMTEFYGESGHLVIEENVGGMGQMEPGVPVVRDYAGGLQITDSGQNGVPNPYNSPTRESDAILNGERGESPGLSESMVEEQRYSDESQTLLGTDGGYGSDFENESYYEEERDHEMVNDAMESSELMQ